jgi:hypothetical protein
LVFMSVYCKGKYIKLWLITDQVCILWCTTVPLYNRVKPHLRIFISL